MQTYLIINKDLKLFVKNNKINLVNNNFYSKKQQKIYLEDFQKKI